MPLIPCGFGDNWLLRNPSPAAISTQRITILVQAIRDLKKTRPRRQARVLNGDLRVKCFFLFLRPMITILQAPSITLHGPIMMSGCMFTVVITVLFLDGVLPNIAFSVISCCRSTPYFSVNSVLPCIALRPRLASPAGRRGEFAFGSAFLQD